MDHVCRWLDEPSPTEANAAAKGSTSRSLVLAEPGANIVFLEYGEEPVTHPTLLSPKKGGRTPADFSKKVPGQQPAAILADEVVLSPTSGSPQANKEGSTEALSAEDEATAGSSSEALVGSWTCIATNGLEEFLKKTGVGAFQRKLAMAARWPSWDFTLESDRVKFVNHSALGDLHEEILLDGSSYQWKDGRGNPLTCTARWMPTADGGILTISKSGALGRYSEERRVTGDTLVFVLTNEDGASWGRTFQRAA
jgi:hypothetical protein